MFEQYGIQQIYSVCIKAISPVKIGERQYGTNETILYLTDVEGGKMREQTSVRVAEGGQYEPRLIQWFTHNNVDFYVQKGVMSRRDFNFLLDSNIIKDENVVVSTREIHTASSGGIVKLEHATLPGIYCYDEQGNKLKEIKRDGKQLDIGLEYAEQEITVDYSFEIGEAHTYSIGENFLSNIIVKAEIMFLLKDDNDGEEYTGILTIPTANVNGDINLIMGKKATPIVGDFVIQSVRSKTENRGQHSNYTLKILDRDISAI